MSAQLLVVPAQRVAVASTGLIGLRLPMDKLLPGVDERRRRAVRRAADWMPPPRS